MTKTAASASIVYAELLGLKFPADNFSVEPGIKYDRIVQGNSVHAFVRKEDGAVFKAAGWALPAKGVRFTNILDAVEKADRFGGYLYR